MFRKSLSFDDVLLLPQFSDIVSRSEVCLRSSLGRITSDLPIVSSPMDTVTEGAMASAISETGGISIIHRYNTIEEQVEILKSVRPLSETVGAAIGVSDDFLDRTKALVDAGVKIICIDVAHGHHALVRYAIETLKRTFGGKIHIMAGNVATSSAFEDLCDWGADSIRVGIGGGSICSTRIQTGHGMPTFQSVLDCAQISDSRSVPIIADGGIKNSGDIVKALAAGASFVMLGSLLSGTAQSPGSKVFKDGSAFKEYRGMASERAQMNWRGRVNSREGVAALVPFKGDVKDILGELEAGIRSGLSYSGARSIEEFQVKADIVEQTSSGKSESETHIFKSGNLI